MKNVGKFWTKQEELTMLDELGEKKTIPEISKLHERSEKAIEMRIESMIHKHAAQNYPISSLKDLYNKTEKEIKKILNTQQTEYSSSNKKSIDERLTHIENMLDDIHKTLKVLCHYLKKK